MTTHAPQMPTSPSTPRAAGIASLGLCLPSLALPVEELARLRGQDPKKFTLGLGCREMALCPDGVGAIDLAVEAARRALSSWDGSLDDIGLVAVGTESAVDMSRPLSAWVADRLGISGAVRSYEVKHACYGGTLALRQALEWKLAGAGDGRAALVIASDVALYAVGDPGEPTQGAGAVAFIVDDGKIATIAPRTYAYSEPAFDFWRPVGEEFPRVEGPLSLDCYKRGAEQCFKALIEERGLAALDGAAAICYHVPFPKMVKKAALHVGESLGLAADDNATLYADKIDPFMDWNRLTGNAYTASLWIAVAQALAGMAEGEEILAFSYGSGFGTELLSLTAGPDAAAGAWTLDVERDLASRQRINAAAYSALRGEVAALAA